MNYFVPDRPENTDWDPDKICEQFRLLRTRENCFEADTFLQDNCYVLVAIVSRFCRENGCELDLDSEVAFIPDIIYRSRLKAWAPLISGPLNAPISYKDWNLVVIELVLGAKATVDNPWSTTGNSRMAASQGVKGAATQHQLPHGTVLGAQANGVAAVLDIVVKPSIKPDSMFVFHVGRGQILTLPITENGYIEASARS